MLTKKVTYEDFNGNTVTEELQFNLTKTEAMDIAFALPDDVKKTVQTGPEDVTEELAKKILARMGDTKIFDFIKTVVLKAYGEVSEDGRKFIKKDENGKDLSEGFAFLRGRTEIMACIAPRYMNGFYKMILLALKRGKLSAIKGMFAIRSGARSLYRSIKHYE